MQLRRYVCRLFLTVLTLTMLGTMPLSAQTTTPTTTTQCKLSDFDAGTLASMAKEAKSNMVKADNALRKMVLTIRNAYEREGGPCHYLHGSSSKWWDEFFRAQLSFSSDIMKGAKKVDEILHTQQTVQCAKEINGDVKVTTYGNKQINLASYTDWDINDLRSRVYASNNESNKIANWAKSAKKGQFMKLSESDSKDLICARVQCRRDILTNDCDYVVKGDGNSFSCVDSGGSTRFPMVRSDGKCYDPNNPHGSPVACIVGSVSDRDIAYTFDSPDDFVNKIQGDNMKQCINELEEAAKLRGKPDTPDTFLYYRKKAIETLKLFSGEDEDCQCKEGTDGAMDVDCPQDSTEEDNMDDDSCPKVSDYEQRLSGGCFACRLFANIMGAVQKISHNSFDATGGPLIELLAIAYLIFIGYKTLLTIASPEAIKLSKYLTELLFQGTKVAITVLILMNPSFLYNKVLSPILVSSVDFGMSLTGVNSEKAMETGKKYANNFDFSDEYFSGRTAQIMVGAVENFSNGATTMPAIGSALVCHSFQNLDFYYHLKVIPHISMFVEGSMLYIAGIIIWLSIGYYMLDCAVELGIVCALMAFFVACWPFKLTSGYTKIGWNMFLNVFFNFVMMGIIVATIIGLSVQALSVGTTKEELISMINSDDVPGLNDTLQLGGLQTLMVLVCCAICIKLPEEAGRLANKFASGAQIGEGAGGLGGAVSGDAAKIGTRLAVGDFGNKGKIGGLGGLLIKGAKAEAKSIGENTGATGALKAGANAAKRALGMGKKQDQITNGFKKDEQGENK